MWQCRWRLLPVSFSKNNSTSNLNRLDGKFGETDMGWFARFEYNYIGALYMAEGLIE
ncbi:MAG: hypothetical protein ACJAUG_002634 [Halioglobus sp.]|jgi:hypothetical protein